MPFSLSIAFLAGVLTLLPACGPALLPAFFGFTFKQKSKLVLATIFFGLGFSLLFIPFSLGLKSLVWLLVGSRPVLFTIVGWLLILFGIASLFDLHLRFYLTREHNEIKKPWQTFWLGIIFGLTSSTCIAPVYGSIISISVLPDKFFMTLSLLFSFVLGMIVPLIILALIFEHYGFLRLKFLQLRIFNIPLSNLISAAIFIPLGIAFILAKGGTPFSNISQAVGIIDLFQKLNEKLIALNTLALDIWFLAVIALACFYWLKRRHS